MVCPYTFTMEPEIKNKIRRSQHICDSCDQIFVTRRELRAHKSTCDLRCGICKYCGEKFSSFAGVRLHTIRKHEKEEIKLKAPIKAAPKKEVLKLMAQIEIAAEPGTSVLDAMVSATGLNKDQIKYKRRTQDYCDKLAELIEEARAPK